MSRFARLRLLGPYLRPSRARITIAGFALVLKDSPLWVLPVVTADVIDLMIVGADPSELALPGAVAIGVILVNLFANAVYVRTYSTAVRELGLRARADLAEKLQTLSISFHSRSSPSVLHTKVIRDVENIELMLQQSFGPILNSVSILIGACAVVAFRAPPFLAVILLTVPMAVILMRWLRARTTSANEDLRREIESMSTQVGEMGSLLPITRAHGLEKVALSRFTESTERVRTAGLKLDLINGRFGAISWASYQMLSLACLFGAVALSLTSIFDVSAGDVILLSSYFSLLTGTLVAAFQLAPLITRGFESLTSINEVLAEDDIERNAGKRPLPSVRGTIEFAGVTACYGRTRAISDLDLTIRAGETVAFIGSSGSGKSTLLNLALGLIPPTSGSIRIDGHDLRDVDLRSYRRHISVVPQEPILFAGSVRENVAYGLPDVSDADVWGALERANAADFVRELRDGWDTTLGDRGSQLSGGQRQRIAIARALIRQPRILILDEPTSALDPTAEVSVRAAIDEVRRGRTTLIVAHRLSTIRTADRIAVLERGNLVEIGSHDELATSGARYRRLLDASNT